jgi:lipopolysaccharide/colanic/teichoic acid biosynthesis glycosyltransferase
MKKQKLQHWILAGDLAWVLMAMGFAYLIRYGPRWYGPAGGSVVTFVPALLGAIGLWAVMFSAMKLDGFRRGWDFSAIISQLFLGVCFLVSFLLAGSYLARSFASRLTLSYFSVLLFVGFVAIRWASHAILGSRYLSGAVRRVVIVGSGPVAREMATKIERHPEMLCKVVGFLCSVDTSIDSRAPGVSDQKITVHTLGVIELLRAWQVHEVIITLAKPGLPEVMNLSALCRRDGIGVSVVPHPYELYLSKPQLLDIGGLPVLHLREANGNFSNAYWKRSVDTVLGFILFLFSLPVIALGATLLLRKKGGPFLRELRCGQSGKLFWMCRLNSDRDCATVPRWELILQQLSITELPQLWNVLRGEMSLVGPRPESPERVKHYSDWQRQRLKVKPGMTGLAQVHGLRHQNLSEEKARFDLQYMLHPSLFLDISLLLQTMWTLAGRLFGLGGNKQAIEQAARGESEANIFLEGRLPGAHSTQSSAD